MTRVTRDQVNKLVGKPVYAVRKDGTKVSGKLVRISGNQLIIEQAQGKKVSTKAFIPLVLFDLLAIGTAPYGGFYGGWGGWGGGWDGWW